MLLLLLFQTHLFARSSAFKPIAQPLASASNVEELSDLIGEHPSLVPPIAWSFEREIAGVLTFSQTSQFSGLVVINWGDNEVEAFQVNAGLNQTFVHDYDLSGLSGPFTVEVRACADDITRITANFQELIGVNVSGLSSLLRAYLNNNKINGTVDFGNCPNMELISLQYNEDPVNANNINLIVNNTENLQAYKAALGPDLILTTATSLKYVNIWSNQVQNFTLPTSAPDLKDLRFDANQVDHDLDFSNFSDLETIKGQGNDITEVNLSGLTKLKVVNLRGNRIRNDVDLSGSQDLNSVDVAYNQDSNVPGNLNLLIKDCKTIVAYKAAIAGTIDLKDANSLEYFNIWANQCTNVVMPNSPVNLTTFRADANQLTNTLDFSACTSITNIKCDGNQLNQVILPSLASSVLFTDLNLSSNQLTNIDAIGTMVLTYTPTGGTILLQGGGNASLTQSIKDDLTINTTPPWVVQSN